eukprot:11768070-Heterocapsa_arctica.AAC.1
MARHSLRSHMAEGQRSSGVGGTKSSVDVERGWGHRRGAGLHDGHGELADLVLFAVRFVFW